MKIRLKHQKLREILSRSRLSQNRWAQKLGLSRGHFSDLVNGRHLWLSPDTRQKLIEGLKVDFEDLFELETPGARAEGERTRKTRRGVGPMDLQLSGWPRADRASNPGGFSMSTLIQDVRYMIRSLRRRPAYTMVLVLTLALGIGVNSAVFSVVNTVMIRPLPYPEPERLVDVSEAERGGRRGIAVTSPNYVDIREQSQTLESMAMYRGGPAAVVGGDVPLRIPIYQVTEDFFQTVGVAPAIGRVFASDEMVSGGANGAILSHGLWATHFGALPSVVGETISVFGLEMSVIGVMPAGFEFPRGAGLWVPLQMPDGSSRTAHNNRMIARLKPEVQLADVRAELSTIAGRLALGYPGELEANFDFAVNALHAELVGEGRSTLVLLFAVVGVVLLIACSNMASLLMSQAVGRRKEIAIRRAGGAGTRRLIGQLLTESAIIGFIGAGAGLALAWTSLTFLNSIVPADFLHSGPIAMDWRVVAFTLTLGVVTGILFGVAPAWRTARYSEVSALRADGSQFGGGTRRRRLSGLAVVPQYGFSLAALIVAGLILRSVIMLGNVDPGFSTDGLLTAEISLPLGAPSRYSESAEVIRFYRTLSERSRALPGVRSVTLDMSVPLTSAFRVNGVALKEGMSFADINDSDYYPDYRVVGPDYFRTIGIPLARGRDFESADSPDAPPVAIINEAMARQMWNDNNPIGRQVMVPGLDFNRETAARWLTIVGVASDVHHRGLDLDPRPAVYVPYLQHLTRAGRLALVLATSGGPETLVNPVRELIRGQDPNLPIGRIQTMSVWVRESLSAPRFRAGLLGGIGVLAVLLALLGVYGVMSYSVAQRKREMAIRIAVGARASDLLKMLLKEGGRFVIAGQVVGTIAALALTRLLEGLLFGIGTTDPFVYWTVSPAFAAVVLLTCYLPARRAGQVDPIETLKG